MWQFFSHIWWFPYFFLTFDGSILTLCNSNITCDSFFSYLVVSLLFFSHIWRFHSHILQFQHHMWQFFSHIWWFPYFFFLTFDGFIFTLCSSFVICDIFFYHIWWFSYFFFSHLMVPTSHCVVPISYMTVLFSHLVVPLLFSYIWRFHPYIVQF